jgi:hypothetical protein
MHLVFTEFKVIVIPLYYHTSIATNHGENETSTGARKFFIHPVKVLVFYIAAQFLRCEGC